MLRAPRGVSVVLVEEMKDSVCVKTKRAVALPLEMLVSWIARDVLGVVPPVDWR